MGKATILAILVIIFALTPSAWAHPFIDQTDPPSLSNALVGTDSVTVWYSEAIDLDYSSLQVFDSSGKRVDNSDTTYHIEDTSLHVTTSPLQAGVYTVSSSTLSKIDGHLVGDAFVFAVGDATIDADTARSFAPSAQVFIVEAAAKFPGLVGQTLVLGASIAMLLVWSTRRILGASKEFEQTHHSKFMILVGAGAIAIIGSDIFMLAAHASLLGAPIFDALGTTFGNTILVRIALSVALIVAWFVADRRGPVGKRWAVMFAALGLGLAATFTMVGHGAASEISSAIALDYAHNVIAGVWIGGVAYLLFVMLPYVSGIGKKTDMAVRALVPTFSAIFVVCVGVAAVTGPLLLWLLEDNAQAISGSTYGAILIAKLALGTGMIIAGAYNWRLATNASKSIMKKLRRSLRIELFLGVALLASVALLTNTTLPGGEAQQTASSVAPAGLDTVLYSAGAAFDTTVWPLTAGSNTVTVFVTDPQGNPLNDLEGVRVTITSVDQGIAPLKIDLAESANNTYSGNVTLGFWGRWDLQLEAIRSVSANESATIRALAKPPLSGLSLEIIDYDLPSGASPLHIEHDQRNTIWMSDPASPRLWSYDITESEFTEHAYEGAGSVILDIDDSGNIWFTDIRSASIGSLDVQTGQFNLVPIPESLWNTEGVPIPVWLHAGSDGSIWVSIPNKNSVLEYDPISGIFEVHTAPTVDSAPLAVIEDSYGDIWFTAQSGQSITRIDRDAGTIKEIELNSPLQSAETITFGTDGNAWISEHREGGGIARVELSSGSVERILAPDEKALANSVSFDRHQNVWFALHTVDSLAVYDPSTGELAQLAIPTPESWVQFTVADPDGNIWFAQQRAAKLGMVNITDPGLVSYAPPVAPLEFSLAQIIAPLMALAIIASGLLVVRAVRKRRDLLSEFS